MSLCVISLQWWQVEKVNPIKLYEENKVIAGFSLLNILFKHRKSGLLKSVMEKLLRLYEQKKIKPLVDSLWALEEVGARCGQMKMVVTASRENQSGESSDNCEKTTCRRSATAAAFRRTPSSVLKRCGAEGG